MEPRRVARIVDGALTTWLLGLAPFHGWVAAAGLIWAIGCVPGLTAAATAAFLASHPLAIALALAIATHAAWVAARARPTAAARVAFRVLAIASLASPFAAMAVRARVVAGFPLLTRAIEESIKFARADRFAHGTCDASSAAEECRIDLVEALAPELRPFKSTGKHVVEVRLRAPADDQRWDFVCDADGRGACSTAAGADLVDRSERVER